MKTLKIKQLVNLKYLVIIITIQISLLSCQNDDFENYEKRANTIRPLYKKANVIFDSQDNIISLDNGITWLENWHYQNGNIVFPGNDYFYFTIYTEYNLITIESNIYDLYNAILINNNCHYIISGEPDSLGLEYNCLEEHLLNDDYFNFTIHYLNH